MEETRKEIGAARMQRIADGLCLLVAVLWGTGFIATQRAIDAHMSAPLIMAIRFVVGTAAMLPLCFAKLRHANRGDLWAGMAAGALLFCAFITQLYGQARTSVSNTAFITATNVVMVPFLVWIATRKRPEGKTFALAAVSLLGIGLLTVNLASPGKVNIGDGLVLVCAFLYACHIFYLGRAVEGRDAAVVSFFQMGTAAALSLLSLLLLDREAIATADLKAGLAPVLYLGLVGTSLCFFLQTYAQKFTSQSRASICLSTEGLFGSLFAVVLGIDPLNWRLVVGGVIILTSVFLLEAPLQRRPSKHMPGSANARSSRWE